MTRNDWIPVKERLPEKEDAYYWVTTSYGKIVKARYTNELMTMRGSRINTDWHWDLQSFVGGEVIAWAPLNAIQPYEE